MFDVNELLSVSGLDTSCIQQELYFFHKAKNNNYKERVLIAVERMSGFSLYLEVFYLLIIS